MQQKTEPRLTGKEHYTLEVSNPVSVPAQTTLQRAPRLADLNGKTVCEVWNGSFKGEVTFPVIRELLRKRYPHVKVIPYTEFPTQRIQGSTRELQERVQTAVTLAVEKSCDAVISGNGG